MLRWIVLTIIALIAVLEVLASIAVVRTAVSEGAPGQVSADDRM